MNLQVYNFYKIQIDTEDDLKLLENLKPQAVVSVKCDNLIAEKTKQQIQSLKDKIIDSRIILVKKVEDARESTELTLTVDHLARFVDCCKANIEFSTLLEEELSEVCK